MRQAWHLVLYMHQLFNLLTGHSIERALTAWCLGREGQVCLPRYASGQTQVVTHNLKSETCPSWAGTPASPGKGPCLTRKGMVRSVWSPPHKSNRVLLSLGFWVHGRVFLAPQGLGVGMGSSERKVSRRGYM